MVESSDDQVKVYKKH